MKDLVATSILLYDGSLFITIASLMRLSASFAVAPLLLAIACAAHAAPVASASDIDKAMNLLPPDVQKDLNQPQPADTHPKVPAPPVAPPMSQHCRQLLAAIDNARYTPLQMPRDSYPSGPGRYGRSPWPATSPAEGWQVDAGNSLTGRSGSSAYSRRVRLETQFDRECR